MFSPRLARRLLRGAWRPAAARWSSSTSPVPRNFGGENGPCITNKSTVLHTVDAAISPAAPRPPDVEILLTEHLAYTANPVSRFIHREIIALGHILIRYTTSDGTQRVMNILGGDALDDGVSHMVNFAPPEEYLYGTAGFGKWSQQGGAYNRDIVGLRIEHAPEGVVDALHAYYEALAQRSRIAVHNAKETRWSNSVAAARFQLVGGRIYNAMMANLPAEIVSMLTSETRLYRAAGNCAQWTSSGLQWVGLLRRPRMVPKAILIELFEREHRLDPSNVHLVIYKHVQHAEPFWVNYKPTPTYVHPLYFVRNVVYARMDRYADVIVRVPEGTTTAVVERVPPEVRLRPPKVLPVLTTAWLATSALAILGFFDGPTPAHTLSASAIAGIWLGLNWFTH